ncbi:MAG: carbonic anhydrase [Chitinophagaceae bacterium]
MWLRNIKDVYRIHKAEIDSIEDEETRTNRLVELNVQEQIYNLAKTSIIQRCWLQEGRPDLHGWVYGLKDGVINPVCEMKTRTPINEVYKVR